MSKACEECKYFGGFDYDDGSVICEHPDAGRFCPYNDCETVKHQPDLTGINVVINGERISEYIKETIYNTIENTISNIINDNVKSIVKDTYEEKIKKITEESIKMLVEKEIVDFMSNDITIGGGWDSPSRTISRTEYLNESVKKMLNEKLDDKGIRREVEAIASKQIDSFMRNTRDEINRGIKNYFDEATKQVLTENVVSMLMCNDTYKKLANSMGCLLGNC